MNKLFRICLPCDVSGKKSVQVMDYFISLPLPTRRPTITRMETKARQSAIDKDRLFCSVDQLIAYAQQTKANINQPTLRLVYQTTGYNSSGYEIMWEWDDVERDDEMADRVNKLAQELEKEAIDLENYKIRKADRKIYDSLRNKHGW